MPALTTVAQAVALLPHRHTVGQVLEQYAILDEGPVSTHDERGGGGVYRLIIRGDGKRLANTVTNGRDRSQLSILQILVFIFFLWSVPLYSSARRQLNCWGGARLNGWLAVVSRAAARRSGTYRERESGLSITLRCPRCVGASSRFTRQGLQGAFGAQSMVQLRLGSGAFRTYLTYT